MALREATRGAMGVKRGGATVTTIRMEEMTAPEIRAAMERGFSTVVVAIGSTEQHGPHLPTMTDTRIGDEYAHRVALKLGNALQARTVPIGASEHHLAFGGTISLSAGTLRAVLRDVVSSLVRCGFARIVLLPSNGGNFSTVQEVIEETRTTHPGVAVTGYTDLLELGEFLVGASASCGVSAGAAGMHAGESETSIMLALEPQLARTERFAAGYVGPFGEEQVRVVLEQGMPALSESGVLGDPTGATAERGEVYLELLADFVAAKLDER
jgi:creatinine amidohydrolase